MANPDAHAPLPGTPSPTSTVAALARIEAQLATLHARTAWLEQAQQMGPRMLGAAGDVFDSFAENNALDARMSAALELVEHLTRPEVLQRLSKALALAEQLPKLAAAVADTFDGYADLAEAAGVELDSFAPRLGELSTSVATALQAAEVAPPAPAGIFALLRELKDPHVRQALGFALGFAKAFGRTSTQQPQ